MDSALPKGIWIAIVVAVGVSMFGIYQSMKPIEEFPKEVVGENAGDGMSGDGPVHVVLDPGHGGGDGGTVVFSLLEKELALDISLRVQRALRRNGIRALMTRRSDHDVALEERVAIARKYPGTPFVSIHLNRFKSASVSGAEVYVMDGKPVPLPVVKGYDGQASGDSELHWTSGDPSSRGFYDRRSTTLGSLILDRMTEDGELNNRGLRQRKLFVVEHAPPPAVLIECGYLSNPSEARKFSKAAFREKVALDIAEGITAYLEAAADNPTYGFKRDSKPGDAVLTIK